MIAVRLFAPLNRVGVGAVILDDEGRVLLVEHLFRTNRKPWGLPGGWVGRGEDPAAALRREIREELGVELIVDEILLCETPERSSRLAPTSIAIIYRGHLPAGATPSCSSRELLDLRWFDPRRIDVELLAVHAKAIQKTNSEVRGESAE